MSEGQENFALFQRNCPVELFIRFAMSGIKSVIAYHLKVLFRDMTNQTFNEIQNGNGFDDKFTILVAIIMKSNHIASIAVNTRGSNDGTSEVASEVAANVFNDGAGIT